jgi:serine/threonine protein kinase
MVASRYKPLEKIDVGGMAEVWKARSTSMEGFDKLVAIKRILPGLSQQKKFMSMFLDEARLALNLNHANVVQTFDIGVSDNTYFIVMEWIDGTQLKSIYEAAIAQGYKIPKQQAAYIIAEVCKGLSHAHQRRDESGESLNIVHRDVSPPNVLISREGEVKLADFGLAKAQSQVSATDPGVVKGKFGYLSPEAAHGNPIDPRSDLFSAGIVLWEALAGQKLFNASTNLETIKLVRAANIPPLRDYNPDIDDELDAIVQRSLSKNADDRFQSADEFGHALTYYLFSNRLMVTSSDIALLVKRTLAEREKTRPMLMITPEFMANAQEVQGELGGFVSLEQLERMSFQSVSASYNQLDSNSHQQAEEHLTGSIDPRSWAGEFNLPAKTPELPIQTQLPPDEKTIIGPPPVASQPHEKLGGN